MRQETRLLNYFGNHGYKFFKNTICSSKVAKVLFITQEPILAICNSYTMGKRDLPDIYAQARGPQARGRGHIYQENPECPCYN